jgi:hypothetical protein
MRALFRITLTLLIALPMFLVFALFFALLGMRAATPAPEGEATLSSERVGRVGQERTAT